ncbi:MAG: PqqD family protein [Salinisphaera sp.]|nr:PqqD family protein [Salinisphaera sp.]
MTTAIRADSIVVRTRDQVTADLGQGQTALMSVERGSYYGLNEVGARIWQLCAQPRRVDAIAQRLAREYEVTAGQAIEDVTGYVQALRAEGLLRVCDADASDPTNELR